MKPYRTIIATILAVFIALAQAQAPTSAQANEILAKKSGCYRCHRPIEDKRAVGPTFGEIANKYRTDSLSKDKLLEKVKRGGKGNWTEISHGVPMPPFSGRLSDQEIQQLVDWILKGQTEN